MGFIYITEKDLARTREKDKRKKDTKNNLKFLSCILFLLVSIAVIAILGIAVNEKLFLLVIIPVVIVIFALLRMFNTP